MQVNPVYHQSNDRLQEELDWIKRSKLDPEDFAPLYRRYHDQIFRYIYQRMDDSDSAFDVTSQVFMKALKNIANYEYRGVPFSSWLYRIAKSEVYQSFRDKKAQRTVNLETYHIADLIDDVADDNLVMNKEILVKSLQLLKEKDLQLIEMRFFEQRPFKEIGEILELTENNAKVKAFRALEKLKQHFKSLA
jgi:RNA polymerase sigma-70 factor (ECF subfamily)